MERLAAGIILTSFGLHGELKVKSLSGETDHFFRMKEVFIKQGENSLRFQVEGIRKKSGDIVILKLCGIDTPEDGKRYRGRELWVSREYACPVYEDEYYYGDLCTCTVIHNDREIGKVISVFETGLSHVLEVADINGVIVHIPFTNRVVGEVNIRENKIFLMKEAEID
ncbi:MAG: 16S rRNA processing protein RimM [Spirochaetales bacterium]|nr:16S rRNA processing protein RimM [Spirochaetales bacterium]